MRNELIAFFCVLIVIVLLLPPAISSSITEQSSFNDNIKDVKNIYANEAKISQTETLSINDNHTFNYPSAQLPELYSSNYDYYDVVKVKNNPDGTSTSEFYIKPSFYLDGINEQQYIDTTIIKLDELNSQGMDTHIKNNYQFQCTKNNLKTYFRDQYSPSDDDKLVYLTRDFSRYPLTWEPLGIAIEKKSTSLDQDLAFKYISNKDLDPTTAKIEENRVLYPDIFPGCDDQYTILPNKIKHDLILNQHINQLPTNENGLNTNISEMNDPEHYVFDYFGILELPENLVPYVDNQLKTSTFETSGYIEFRESMINSDQNIDEVIYNLIPPVAYEKNSQSVFYQCSNILIPLSLELGQKTDNAYPMTGWSKILYILRTDLTWLLDENRVYPVVLDPVIEVPSKSSKGMDTYLVMGNQTHPELSSYNFGQERELIVSIAGPSLYSRYNLYYRSILKFPGLELITEHAQILEAKLILQLKTGGDEDLAITVYKLLDPWLEGEGTTDNPQRAGACWNNSGYNIWLGGNYNGYNTNAKTVIVTTPTYYVWDVLDIVNNWVKSPWTNHGFLITGTDYEDVLKVFHSSEAFMADVRPKLTVKYNTPPRHTGFSEIVVNEDEKRTIQMTDIFSDPDIITASHEDILSFQIWDGTYERDKNDRIKGLNFVYPGVYSSENLTIELRTDNKLVITPAGAEKDGLDVIPMRVRDRYIKNWLEVPIQFKVKATNDPPKITSIGGKPIYDDTVELTATEAEAEDFFIEVKDPDNKEFLESRVTNKSNNAPADLEFRWEKDKTKKFTIAETEDSAFITFNPDNDLVGLFYINITVYDTYWSKPNKYAIPRKYEVSNHTVMIIFEIANINNPPSNLRIIDPRIYEFTAEDIITFKGRCKDPDLDIPNSNEKLSYSWSSDLDGALGQGLEIKTTLSKGKHLINFSVEDSSKQRSQISVNITIRNRATIDYENCSHVFTDDNDDVLGYYYSLSDIGEKEFYIMRESGYPEYDIYIDIIELTSIRFKNYLFINLTMRESMRLNLESKNYKYKFSIYLIKPNNDEVVFDIKNMDYNSRLFDSLYSPDKSLYYAVFGLEDGVVINNGRTLSIKKHLGDLEYGDGINQKLLPEFTLFATAKVELKQHPADSFEHLICYDSIGYGSKPAPQPKQKVITDSDKEGETSINIGLVVAIIIIAIIVVSVLFVYIRQTRLEDEKTDEMTLDISSSQMQIPLAMQQPGQFQHHPQHGQMGFHGGIGGVGIGVRPGTNINPQIPLNMQFPHQTGKGGMGMGMVPMLPPRQVTQSTQDSAADKKRSKKKKFLKK